MRLDASRCAVTVSVVLFVISLALPTFCDNSLPCQGNRGAIVLALGWLGLVTVPDSPANLAWLANPSIGVAWVMVNAGWRTLARTFSTVALALGLVPFITRMVAVDESGFARPIVSFAPGYAAWLAAIATAMVAAWLMTGDRT